MQLKQTAQTLLTDVKHYWNKPPAGRYMPFKEIAAYSVGGIGACFIFTVVQAISLSVGNFIIGNAIGIEPTKIYLLYVIAILSSFPLTALRANIIDSARSKKGKYRPYLLYMGVPTVILAIGFVWMPYEHMSMPFKMLTVLLFNIGFQFFYMFFNEAYENLILVLSPNTQERTDTATVKSVIYSLAPSIVNIVMPMAAKFLTNGDMTNLKLYRFAYPPMLILGILLSIMVYANTQEKIIQAKTHVVQVKFIDALRAVGKNKYFWIISLASWLGFLEASYGTILQWLYQYQHACTEGQFALIQTLYGNASLWGMLMAPWAIRRFGKKRVLLVTNFLNIVFIGAIYPIVVKVDPRMCIWLVLICLFSNGVVGAFAHVLNPSIQGDIRDYQQYITGERIDGMFSTVGLVGQIITLATSGVLPAVYERCGITTENAAMMGYTNAYDVLYNRNIFEDTFALLVGLSVFGAIMNVIPYFFYDLTETKQRGMINVLKVRALFEDYGNNALSDRGLVETIDLVNEAREYTVAEPLSETKDSMKEAKRSGDKAAVKAAKKARKAAIEHNRMIEISRFVIEEMNKFSTLEMQEKVAIAKEVYAAGLSNLVNVEPDVLQKARALPKKTEEEKLYRKAAIEEARDRLTSKKVILKHYPNGLVEFDSSIFDGLFAEEDRLEMELEQAYKALFAAKESKDQAAVKQARLNVQKAKVARAKVRTEIKEATNANSIYHHAAKPWLDAKKLLTQEENYRHYDEIAAMYEEAKIRAQAQEAREDAEEAAKEAQKKADKEMARTNRRNK